MPRPRGHFVKLLSVREVLADDSAEVLHAGRVEDDERVGLDEALAVPAVAVAHAVAAEVVGRHDEARVVEEPELLVGAAQPLGLQQLRKALHRQERQPSLTQPDQPKDAKGQYWHDDQQLRSAPHRLHQDWCYHSNARSN